MRFVTVAGTDGDRVGVIDGDAIHLLPPGMSLLGLLGDDGERLHAAGERALRDPDDVIEVASARLRAPLKMWPVKGFGNGQT